jgi:hypothetical protein
MRADTHVRFRDVETGCALSVGGDKYCWNATEGGAFLDSPYAAPGDCGLVYFWYFVGRDCWSPTRILWDRKVVNTGGCLLAADGVLACVGSGENGNLGDGRAGPGVYAITPVEVSGGRRYLASSGRCAIDVQRVAYCWGRNTFGQLGIGVRDAFRSVPTPVLTDQRFVEIVSNLNTCALTATDEVWCWGPNEYGINGPTAQGAVSTVPVKVVLPPL